MASRLRSSSLPLAEDAAVLVPGANVAAQLWGRVRVSAWREASDDASLRTLLAVVRKGVSRSQQPRGKAAPATGEAAPMSAANSGSGSSSGSSSGSGSNGAESGGAVPVAVSRDDVERAAETASQRRKEGAVPVRAAEVPGARRLTLRRLGRQGRSDSPPEVGARLSGGDGLTDDDRRVLATAGLLLARATSAVEVVDWERAVADDDAAAPKVGQAPSSLGASQLEPASVPGGSAAAETGPDGGAAALQAQARAGPADPIASGSVGISAFLQPPSGLSALGLGLPPAPPSASGDAFGAPRTPDGSQTLLATPAHRERPSAPQLDSHRFGRPGALSRPFGEPFVIAGDAPLGTPQADVLPRARRVARWAVAASARTQAETARSLLCTVQDALASQLPTRAEINSHVIRSLVPFACAAPVLVARTISADGWSALQELLALPAQPFAISTEVTVGSAVVLAMPPVKPDPIVMARDLVISRFLHHMPAHSIASFSISPSLMAATTDPVAAAAFFRQHPRLALQAAAFAEARSVVAVPGLGLSLDPRLRWSIDRVGGAIPGPAGRAGAAPLAPTFRQDGFAPCPFSSGRDLADEFTKRLYRGKGVTRTKMAKLESALAAVRRGVEQAAVDCGAVRREELGAPLATPRWVQLATAAADAAMRPTDSFAIHGFGAAVQPDPAAEAEAPAGPAAGRAATTQGQPQQQQQQQQQPPAKPASRAQAADELLTAWLQPMAPPSARPAAAARPSQPGAGKPAPNHGGKREAGSKWELEAAAWTWGGDTPAPVPPKTSPTPKRKRASSGGWGIEQPRR
ncbi:hypothetical protein FNF27_03678 [Cafeteria roenbergensis]|uniref:Uncharacterized protein n=2 Tax=Cafeteria roenbergensis TaxID=33653 RepID=A0A5A8EG36_CAFRO|nr:hypothetical protein FNF27_03678 [Cafeteria roenbergensis]